MVPGHERGATIVNRYVDGVQTNDPLWPYPYEDIIKQHMCDPTDLADAHRVAANGTDWEPGWCATNKTLTEYIWEANGATCPSDICNYSASYRGDVNNSGTINTFDANLTFQKALGLDMSGTGWIDDPTTGDANCTGTTNTFDANLIFKHSLGLDVSGEGWCL